jgi:hypothetical protein
MTPLKSHGRTSTLMVALLGRLFPVHPQPQPRYGLNKIRVAYQVGMNFFESSSCSLNDSGKAAIPAMIPQIINTKDIMDQITPQHCEEPPYRSAKTLASDSLTFRRMRSSHYRRNVRKVDKWGWKALQYPIHYRVQT